MTGEEMESARSQNGCVASPTTSGDEPSAEEISTADDFLQAVADVELDDMTLSYAAVNVLHGRGSLDRKTRRDAGVAIRTLQAILKDAKRLARPNGTDPGRTA